MHCFPSCHLPVPLWSLVITSQGWSYKFSPFMGHSFETGTFPGELLWGLTDRSVSRLKGKGGLGPVGSFRNSQCLSHHYSPGLIPTPNSYLECCSPGPLAPWNSLHFSLWTSHHTSSGFLGRRNCCQEAEPALFRPALEWAAGAQAGSTAAGMGLRPPGAHKGSE